MKLSTERIHTTHVGSLPRPRSLLDLILAKEEEPSRVSNRDNLLAKSRLVDEAQTEPI